MPTRVPRSPDAGQWQSGRVFCPHQDHHRAPQRFAASVSPGDVAHDLALAELIGLLLGAVITYTGWGTWWLVLGIVLVAGGLYGLFSNDV